MTQLKRQAGMATRWLALGSMLLCAPAAWSSTPVGTVLTVKGVVTLVPSSGEASFLDKNSAVYEGDTVISTKKSFAVIGFIDESKVVVKQNTEFKITGFSFEEGEDGSTFNLIKGGIRAVTGTIARENPDNYKLETPVASLGVRGTNYDALVCDEECAKSSDSGESAQHTPKNSECEVRLNIDDFPPGAYFTVRDGVVVITKSGEILTLGPGDVGFANEDSLGCLPTVPSFIEDESTPLPDAEDFRNFSPLQCT